MYMHTFYVCVFILQDQDKEYVGFATLPNQVHRKTVKKGFTFTLMVAGKFCLTVCVLTVILNVTSVLCGPLYCRQDKKHIKSYTNIRTFQ